MKIGKRTIKKLGTIAQEKAACIKAFKGVRTRTVVWCCHHEVLYEYLREPYINRIRHIAGAKAPDEQRSRFRSFRPVKNQDGPLTREQFDKEWPQNTWTGRKVHGTL